MEQEFRNTNYTFKKANQVYSRPYSTTGLRNSIANVQYNAEQYQICVSRYRKLYSVYNNILHSRAQAHSVERILQGYRYEWHMDKVKKHTYNQCFHELKVLQTYYNVQDIRKGPENVRRLKYNQPDSVTVNRSMQIVNCASRYTYNALIFCLQALLLDTERYFDLNNPGGHSIKLEGYIMHRKAYINTLYKEQCISSKNKMLPLQNKHQARKYIDSDRKTQTYTYTVDSRPYRKVYESKELLQTVSEQAERSVTQTHQFHNIGTCISTSRIGEQVRKECHCRHTDRTTFYKVHLDDTQ